MEDKNPNTIKWFSIASVFFILISFVIYWNSGLASKNEKSEDEEAMRLFMQTKTALDSLSYQLNKAQNGVNTLYEFEEVKEKVFKN